MDFRRADWLDLLTLYRNRNKVSCYDSAVMLTRGNPLGLTAMLSYINPRNGVITAAAQADDTSKPVMGQIRSSEGRRNAHLTFVYPDQTPDSTALAVLLDGLAQHAGYAGLFGVLAEVDELAPVFETLRRAGYSVYGWQRIYRLPFQGKYVPQEPPLWDFATEQDEIPIRQLYQSLVPPLVQAADPLQTGRLYGFVYREDNQIQAYIESSYGPDGIYLRPLIHPNIGNIQALLQSLEGQLIPLLGRKVYMAVRSHQSWLENPLAVMNASAAKRQALMVKHLASMQRKPLFSVARSVIDDSGAKPSTPHMESTENQLEKDLSGINNSSF